MKILITGGTGFLGTHLAKALRAKYNDLTDEVWTLSRHILSGGDLSKGFVYYNSYESENYITGYCQRDLKHFKGDLKDKDCVISLFRRLQPDIIYHLAANPIIKLDDENPSSIIDDNIIATQNLLHYCPEDCKFVFASSIVVYGDCDPKTPFDPIETELAKPTSIYGVTKLASEGLIVAYKKLRNISGVSLRFPATVGAGVTHGVIFDFVRKLQSDSEYLEVLGDSPGSSKPYLYIDDAIEALIMFGTNGAEGSINITPDNILTVGRLAMAVKQELDIHKEVKWLGSDANWKGDNPVLRASNGKAHIYNWYPTLDSFCAVKKAVRDIVEETK